MSLGAQHLHRIQDSIIWAPQFLCAREHMSEYFTLVVLTSDVPAKAKGDRGLEGAFVDFE